MKLQITKCEIEITLVLTELEYRALKKLTGKLSLDDTTNMGLDPKESHAISKMYDILSKGGI